MIKRKLTQKKIENILCVLSIVILFIIIWKVSLLSIDGHHDGTVFHPANVVARGGVLFRDAGTYYGPLFVYIQAIFLKLFGNNLSVLRLSAVIFYVISYILYFQIFKRILPKYMLIVSEVVLLLIAPYWMTTFQSWSSVYALVTILGMVWCSIRGIECNNHRYVIFAGVLCAWTFLIRTTVGLVYIVAAVTLWLLLDFLEDKRKFNWVKGFGGGFICGVLPFAILFIMQGTFLSWWNDCIMFIFSAFTGVLGKFINNENLIAWKQGIYLMTFPGIKTRPESFKGVMRLFVNLFPLNNSGIFILLPLTTLFMLFYKLVFVIKAKKWKMDIQNWKEDFILLIIFWFSLASWHQYYPVSEIRHWYWGGFPMVGCLTYFIYFICRQFHGKWQGIAACFLLCAVSVTTIYERQAYYEERREKYIYEMKENEIPELKGLYLSAEQKQFYMDYYDILAGLRETHPERYVENRSFCILLESISGNGRAEVDRSKLPIIVSNSNNAEDFPEHFLAVELAQEYPEQELDPQQFKVRIWLPKDW